MQDRVLWFVALSLLAGTLRTASAQQESVGPGWEVSAIGYGIKPTFAVSDQGVAHVTGMTESFSNGYLWHATADLGSHAWMPGAWQPRIVAESFFYGPGDTQVAPDGTAHVAVHDHLARDAMHIEIAASGELTVRHIETPDSRDGWENSLAFDSKGRLYQATVNPSGPGVVDSLSFNEFVDAQWHPKVIKSSGSVTHSLGTSIAFDANDQPHILFTPATHQTEPTDLIHARRVDGDWQLSPVASGGVRGRFSSLVFDDANRGHAAWLDINESDPTQGSIQYAMYDDARWTSTPVGNLDHMVLGASGGLNTVSMTLDDANRPHLAFGDSRTVNYATLANGQWSIETVLSTDQDRYNGLVEVQLHPTTGDANIVFWESHPTQDGTVRILSPKSNRIPGDANLDGVFDSGDLIVVFQTAKYQVSHDSIATWSDGDWNGDGEFDSSDLITAFIDGRYQRTAVAVPEPPHHQLVLSLVLCHLTVRLRYIV